MSGITAISTNWSESPRTISITTTDNLSVITTAGYFATQAANILRINAGPFVWLAGDFINIVYGDGQGYFTYDATTDAFVAAPPAGGLSATLPSGDIFVGNGSNIATGVPLSGDATMANTGAMTIANNAVTSAKVSPLLMKYTTTAITAAQFNGMYAAPKLILAAGGANTLIVVHRAILAMTFVSAAYANGGVVGFQYDSTVHGAGVAATGTEAAADFFAAASTSFQFNGVAGNTVAISPFTTSVNKGLYLSNLTGAFDTGDSTFVCHLYYSIIPTV